MIQVFDCEQNSPEWAAVRAGIVTASEMAVVLAKGVDRKSPSVTRRKYMLRLAGERILGAPEETYSNAHMDRGHALEGEARSLYAFLYDAEPIRVGFIRNGEKGCSPDSLLGDDGMLEIKTALPSILIDRLLRDDFPPEHRGQCQGALWVAEREWIDLAIYWPGLPLVVRRAHRDEAYIAELAKAVDAFNAELAAIVERVRAHSEGPRSVLREQIAGSIRDITGRELHPLEAR